MDLVRLDYDSSASQWMTGPIVDGWNSLIWTERYGKNGDFTLKTSKIDETLSVIQEDSVVMLRESDDVMIVDGWTVEKGAGNGLELTMVGRSFETVLERRSLRNFHVSEETADNIIEDTPSHMALVILREGLSNSSQPDDNIPGIYTVDRAAGAIYQETEDYDYYAWKTDVYSKLMEVLNSAGLSVRASARNPEFMGKISLGIYAGKDKTDIWNGNQVIFRVDTGDIINPRYVRSLKNFYNVAYVISPLGFRIVSPYSRPAFFVRSRGGTITIPEVHPSGLERRVLPVDASEITKVKKNTSLARMLDTRGRLALASKQAINAFDCEISNLSQYKYRDDYFLGDYVTVFADYGFEETMQVVEYIRSADSSGYKEYPTLTHVGSLEA